jgi:hypothetical protein
MVSWQSLSVFWIILYFPNKNVFFDLLHFLSATIAAKGLVSYKYKGYMWVNIMKFFGFLSGNQLCGSAVVTFRTKVPFKMPPTATWRRYVCDRPSEVANKQHVWTTCWGASNSFLTITISLPVLFTPFPAKKLKVWTVPRRFPGIYRWIIMVQKVYTHFKWLLSNRISVEWNL